MSTTNWIVPDFSIKTSLNVNSTSQLVPTDGLPSNSSQLTIIFISSTALTLLTPEAAIVILFNSTVPPQRVTLPSQTITSSDPAAASILQSFTFEIVIFQPLNV
jgi:hypothetical protein